MKVLILYERITRELEVAILLKNLLESKNHDCIVSHFLEASNFNFFQNKSYDCIIVPHLYNSLSLYRNICRFGKSAQL